MKTSDTQNGYIGLKAPKRLVYLLSEAYRVSVASGQYEKFCKSATIKKFFGELAALSEKHNCKEYFQK
jgi:hypothetical protein